jgi:8-amino-7-oxononanoate synthase
VDLFDKCRQFTRAREVMEAGLYPYFRAISSGQDTEVVIKGQRMIMIGSNNYLGLVSDPRVKEAAIAAVRKFGSGCTGSRFLNGTLELHEQLEHELAVFMEKEACLVFSTGFQTNLGTLSAIMGRSEHLYMDRANHASLVDGARLTFGKTYKYGHNDMADLDRVLSQTPADAGKLVATDGVFSMEGDLARVPDLVELKKKHRFRILIDDAHAIGVMGEKGNGTAAHFGLNREVDLITGTFSKSFASLGGFVAGDEEVIHYLKHFSRELIFSASIPPASTAAVLAALEIMQKEPERRERLWEITHRMRREYVRLGFNVGTTETPIIPIYIGRDDLCFAFWKELTQSGIFANPIIAPAVPADCALIRTSYTATHTDSQMDRVLDVFEKVGRRLGVLGQAVEVSDS